MGPTRILSDEHRVIEQVLSSLERMAAEFRAAGRVESEPALRAVEFFRTFADACHHAKEESLLFPAFEAAGYPRAGGPTGVMLEEHEQGRAAVRAMAQSIEAASRGVPEALRAFLESASTYIALLRQHILKEDTCLFPMAEEALGAEEKRRLAEAFEKVETEEMGAGTHERMLRIAEDLARRYGVPRAGMRSAAPGCGCGHAEKS